MATFDLPSWLEPKEAPWHALIAGAQVGSAIAANRIRAKATYAQIQQSQMEQDLAERKFTASNEAQTLQNEVIRTKLNRDAEDFSTLREWWPQYAASSGDDLKSLEPPNLHNPDTAIKISGLLTEKQRKQSMAEFANEVSGLDLSKPEDQARYLGAFQKFPEAIARAGGVEKIYEPISVAEKIAATKEAALARVAQQRDATLARMDFLYTQLAKTDATKQDAIAVQKERAATAALLAQSDIRLDDARIKEAVARTEAIAVNQSVALGNLAARQQELALQQERVRSRLSDVDYARFESDLRAARNAAGSDPLKRKAAEDAVFEKWGQARPSATPAAPLAPSATNPLGLNLKLK